MADVRALLAAERQSRRISHPHLTYSKNGALTCNVCNLNVKSEQLWPGHLKSLNHRKNVQKVSEPATRPAKRKIESVEHEEPERNYEVDSRKKPKPAPQAQEDTSPAVKPESRPEHDIAASADVSAPVDTISRSDRQAEVPPISEQLGPQDPRPQAPVVGAVDEDEWAAFERDMAEVAKRDYASATVEAAPVSAAELAEQQNPNAVQQREDEAEAEKEEESRRMEEEFEIMEAMEDRVKRLRERREALRTKDPTTEPRPDTGGTLKSEEAPDDESTDEEEVDDWYG